jgi:secondary thiamine-phosphate synthase enzyme
MITQYGLILPAFSRGFHLITQQIIDVCEVIPQIGVMHVFIQHTSASLTVNENADPSVRRDLERHTNVLAPENAPYYEHTQEGSDDMPAHIKASLYGSSISIPISNGQLALGTWQGIYLGEHRDHGTERRLIITLMGE